MLGIPNTLLNGGIQGACVIILGIFMTRRGRDTSRDLQIIHDRYISGECTLEDVIECIREYSAYLEGGMGVSDSEVLCSFLTNERSVQHGEYSTLIVEIRLIYDDLADCENFKHRVSELTKTLVYAYLKMKERPDADLIYMLIIDAIIDLNDENSSFLAMQEFMRRASGDAREFLPYGMYTIHNKCVSGVMKQCCLEDLFKFLSEEGGVSNEAKLYLEFMHRRLNSNE